VKQRDALIDEIQTLKEAAEKQRDELSVAHQSELQQLETELNARNEDALHRCEFLLSYCARVPPGCKNWTHNL